MKELKTSIIFKLIGIAYNLLYKKRHLKIHDICFDR